MTISASDVLTIVKTKQEALLFQQHITMLLRELFTDTPFLIALQQAVSYEKKEKMLELLQHNAIDINDRSQVQIFLQDIRTLVDQLPVLSLTIAFSPKQQTIDMIATWLVTHIKKPMLLDITVQPLIAAGAVLSYKGSVKDYSLKKILEEKYLSITQ